jgi:transcriptional regulator with XRE-family HTH domain
MCVYHASIAMGPGAPDLWVTRNFSANPITLCDHLPMIGPRLKSARNASGLTQAALANLIGTSQSYIAQMEADGREPSMGRVRGLAQALNVAPGYLIGDAGGEMSASSLHAPRGSVCHDANVTPGLCDLTVDTELCKLLEVQPWEWFALQSLVAPSPPDKNGYLMLLHVLRATCPH